MILTGANGGSQSKSNSNQYDRSEIPSDQVIQNSITHSPLLNSEIEFTLVQPQFHILLQVELQYQILSQLLSYYSQYPVYSQVLLRYICL